MNIDLYTHSSGSAIRGGAASDLRNTAVNKI